MASRNTIDTILQKFRERISGKSMAELGGESRRLEIEGYEAEILKYDFLIEIIDIQSETTDEQDTQIVLEYLSDLMEFEQEYVKRQLEYTKGEVGIEALEAERMSLDELTTLDERFEEHEKQSQSSE